MASKALAPLKPVVHPTAAAASAKGTGGAYAPVKAVAAVAKPTVASPIAAKPLVAAATPVKAAVSVPAALAPAKKVSVQTPVTAAVKAPIAAPANAKTGALNIGDKMKDGQTFAGWIKRGDTYIPLVKTAAGTTIHPAWQNGGNGEGYGVAAPQPGVGVVAPTTAPPLPAPVAPAPVAPRPVVPQPVAPLPTVPVPVTPLPVAPIPAPPVTKTTTPAPPTPEPALLGEARNQQIRQLAVGWQVGAYLPSADGKTYEVVGRYQDASGISLPLVRQPDGSGTMIHPAWQALHTLAPQPGVGTVSPTTLPPLPAPTTTAPKPPATPAPTSSVGGGVGTVPVGTPPPVGLPPTPPVPTVITDVLPGYTPPPPTPVTNPIPPPTPLPPVPPAPVVPTPVVPAPATLAAPSWIQSLFPQLGANFTTNPLAGIASGSWAQNWAPAMQQYQAASAVNPDYAAAYSAALMNAQQSISPYQAEVAGLLARDPASGMTRYQAELAAAQRARNQQLSSVFGSAAARGISGSGMQANNLGNASAAYLPVAAAIQNQYGDARLGSIGQQVAQQLLGLNMNLVNAYQQATGQAYGNIPVIPGLTGG